MNKIDELITDLEEVRTYKELQKVPFDFGTGLIENKAWEKDDSYYTAIEQEILDQIDDIKAKKAKKIQENKNKRRYKSYFRKLQEHARLESMRYVKAKEDIVSWSEKRLYLSKINKSQRKKEIIGNNKWKYQL